MPPERQEPLSALALELKEAALELRGRNDPSLAERELSQAAERLRAALERQSSD